jgi:hypothetical protein
LENVSSRRSTLKAILGTFFDHSPDAVSANPQRIERYPQRLSQFRPARFIDGFFALMIQGDEMEAFGRELLHAQTETFKQALFFSPLLFEQQ